MGLQRIQRVDKREQLKLKNKALKGKTRAQGFSFQGFQIPIVWGLLYSSFEIVAMLPLLVRSIYQNIALKRRTY